MVRNGLNMLDSQMNQVFESRTNDVQLIEFKQDFFYAPGFGNVGVVLTTEGVVVIDTCISPEHAQKIYKEIRSRTDLPIRYIIYTHGHMDHVNSAEVFKENETTVIAHENVVDRFKKYQILKAHRQRIGSVQFDNKTTDVKKYDFTYPDITFHTDYEFKLGEKTFQIVHGKGETDDHCFVSIPGEKVIYSGDFFISSFPNIGNPLKEVRFEREWFESLEKIRARQPEFLVPGHGDLFDNKDTIQTALQDIIECLRFVHDEVIYHMNKGTSLEDMLDQIKLPEHLEKSEYIQPHYGCLMFAIKGTHRRYSGWFDGNPTNLQPAKQKVVAKEILSFIPNQNAILEKCKQLRANGEYQMALHLIDLLVFGSEESEALVLKAELTKKLSETNENFIMRNIYKQIAQRMVTENTHK
ncbi:alkyl sulfatase dimerization domain-containing protein [Neobacillus niacini]|uniref:alkyl sulfatase dimerization domain-containing protein n=1 Tax=Neobacillus niacini TaxID=86668 RepID=UPI0021CB57F1|nr:alkyl sulfatase dimerization domain-containing protein [Neobacillus niacini]MCM3767736.1 MBL fold metallo-hydrolase [Neobacillus niacini]